MLFLVGLFNEPVVREGKRERKKVERLTAAELVDPVKPKKTVQIVKGSGTALGDIPYIAAMIAKVNGSDMNILHRCLFGVNDTVSVARNFIRMTW